MAIFELRLPPPSAITLIVREGASFVPDRDTYLRAGDQLLLIATHHTRQAVEQRLRAVGRAGRLARWHGETGDPRCATTFHAPVGCRHAGLAPPRTRRCAAVA
ncbi:hypothetical protein [Actinoplanes sp. NPDC049316]|uniref:hypothetical protein n=1 Tax=Actinoplanes sp. NPDC049316 TaxID=3154727 RepID=UPI00341D98D6